MKQSAFETTGGSPVPAVTADEMQAVDRIATQSVRLGLLQMMENAGRNLARNVLRESPDTVAVLAGDGGNGGGRLACARQFANRGVDVTPVVDRDPGDLSGAAAAQLRALSSMDVPSGPDATTREAPGSAVSPDRVVTLALPKTGLAAR